LNSYAPRSRTITYEDANVKVIREATVSRSRTKGGKDNGRLPERSYVFAAFFMLAKRGGGGGGVWFDQPYRKEKRERRKKGTNHSLPLSSTKLCVYPAR